MHDELVQELTIEKFSPGASRGNVNGVVVTGKEDGTGGRLTGIGGGK